MRVKSESEVAQSCPTLSDPMDCSRPGSSVHGIFQARVLEWGAIAFSVYVVKRSATSLPGNLLEILNPRATELESAYLTKSKSNSDAHKTWRSTYCLDDPKMQ